jgi:hypothetical protein
MKIELFRQIFEKYSNIKFLENPSSGSRFVPCGWTDITDMKLIVACRNSAKAPKSAPQHLHMALTAVATVRI